MSVFMTESISDRGHLKTLKETGSAYEASVYQPGIKGFVLVQ